MPRLWSAVRRLSAPALLLLMVAATAQAAAAPAPQAIAAQNSPTKLHLSWDRDPKTTMTATWQTTGSTTGDFCEYGPDTSYGSKSAWTTQHTYSGASGQQHVARMENLTPGTKYHFRCGDPSGGMSADGVFESAPAGAADFSFVAMGDIGDNSNMRTNVGNIDSGSPFPEIFISTGDNMYSNGANQAGWDNWFAAWQPLTLKGLALMPSLGNHDVSSGGTTNYKGQFALPNNEEWYTFRYGDVAFVALNMNTAYGSGSAQHTAVEGWIKQARADGVRWVVPYFHQPAYSSGSHGSDMGIRGAYEPMFDKYGVDLVLQGHDHNYQRSYPMNASQKVDSCKSVCKDVTGRIWVVTGGGGESLYDPGSLESWQVTSAQTYHHSHVEALANGSLHFRAIDLTKRVIDEFWIVKSGGPSNNAPAVPTITGPASGQTNSSLSFDVQGTDPDNDQVRYTVDWGDAKSDTSPLVNSGTTQAMPHAWAAPGTYQVKAMSTDSKGAASAWSATIAVTITGGGQNNAPATPTIAGPATGGVGASLSFDAQGVDPDNDQVRYTVDWGDTMSDTSPLVNSGTKQAMIHAWTSPGTYQVKAMSTDSRSATSPWSSAIQVVISAGQNSAPPAPTLAGPSNVKVGVPGSFDVTGTDPDNDQVKYTIDWGDTTTDTGPQVASGTKHSFSHAWSAKGTYALKAKSADAPGLESLWSQTFTVTVTDEVSADDKPPVIVHTPVKKAPAGKAIAIAATVTDNVFVHHVDLRWKPEGGTWQVARLASEPGDKYVGEIPAADVKGATLRYYLEAADESTNVARSPAAGEAAPYEVEIESPGGQSGSGALGALTSLALPLLLVAVAVIAGVAASLALRRRRRKAEQAAAAQGFGYDRQGQYLQQEQWGNPQWQEYPGQQWGETPKW